MINKVFRIFSLDMSEAEVVPSAQFVRSHHPPDDIIDGKPKWTQIKVRKALSGPNVANTAFSESEIIIDRLNPTRNMVDEIEDNFIEGEDTQKVLVNMMADLQTELVVTLGDTRVDPKLEEQLMAENQKWDCYKKKHGITKWVPVKEKVALAPMFRSIEKKKIKGQKRKSMADPEKEGGTGGRATKKMKKVARLPSSPRKIKVSELNMTL